MQIFENYDGQSFKMNGKKYVKNFILMPIGEDAIAVYNAFDTKLQLLPATHFSEVKVNNATFQNQESLIETLSPMLFAKVVYSDGILPNQIIYLPEIVREQNLFSINGGGIWRINGIVVGNSQPFQTLINYADNGYNRIDIVIAKGDGTFELIEGEPSQTTANAPIIPTNALLVTSINIFGSEIIDGETPVVGTEFIKKAHEGYFHVLALDDIQNGAVTLQFSPDGANKYKIWNATAIRGFAYSTNPNAQENFWGGKTYFIVNETLQPITLKHSVNGIIGFIFPSGEDMVLMPKVTAQFHYDSKMRYVGVEFKETVVQTLETVTENGFTTSKPLVSYAAENGGIRAQSTDGQKSASLGADSTSGIVTVAKNQNAKGVIKANNVTTQRNLELPNASGTFALTSDVTNSISNIDFQVNQSSAILSLTNSSGQEITSIDLSFLNNEGTTFVYNAETEKLELQNDAGDVLSELPISSFVSNFAKSLSLNASTLSLRDNAGNILNSVEITTSNVSGLATELDTKVDKVNGYSLTENDLTNALKLAYDNAVIASSANATAITNHVQNTSNPHGVTKVQVGLGNVDNTSDINKPISNAQALVNAAKANLNGGNIFSGSQIINGDSNLKISNSGTGDSASLNAYSLNISNAAGNAFFGYADRFTFYKGGHYLDINSQALTATRAIDYPNKSGVIALTSDVDTKANIDGSNATGFWPITSYNSDRLGGYLFQDANNADFDQILIKNGEGNISQSTKAQAIEALGINAKVNRLNLQGQTIDANSLTLDGIYTGFVWLNTPESTIGTLTAIVYSPDWISQTFSVIGDQLRTWTRARYDGSTWSPWSENFTQDNFNPDSKANLAGGNTFNGNQILNGEIKISGQVELGGYNNFGIKRTINVAGSYGRFLMTGLNSDSSTRFGVGVVGSGDTVQSVFIGSDIVGGVKVTNTGLSVNKSGMDLPTAALDVNGDGIVSGQIKSSTAFFVENSSGFSRLTPGDVTLKFSSGDEFYASPNGIARTYGSTFDLYNLNFPEASTDAIVNLPNRAGNLALLEDVAENYQPLVEDSEWINLSHSLPSSFANVVFRYKIKNGNYILDFYCDCLGTSIVGTSDSFQIGLVENADGEFLRSYNLNDWMFETGSSITNLKLKSLGGDNDPITLVGNLRDTSIDKISFRATLPIRKI